MSGGSTDASTPKLVLQREALADLNWVDVERRAPGLRLSTTDPFHARLNADSPRVTLRDGLPLLFGLSGLFARIDCVGLRLVLRNEHSIFELE